MKREPTIFTLFLGSYIPEAIIELSPKAGANHCVTETLLLVDSPISVPSSQAKAMIQYYGTACKTS